MNSNTIKKSVIEGYSKFAKAQKSPFAKLFSCCNLGESANAVAKNIGYTEENLSLAPEGANLGVGCGNPSVINTINSGEVVVDLGSGAGFDAFIISPTVGETGKVIGIDLSDEMLGLARTNASKGDFNNVEFIKGDIEDLPLENEIADHIISNCVINLSLNKGAVYSEAYRVLKSGGKLSVSDVVLEKELPDFVKDSLAGHMACVSGAEKIDDYLDYLQKAGFEEIEVVSKSDFPLELMLADPQIAKIAKDFDFDLSSDEAKDIASRVKSISISARKK